jgi:hypothetical protein
VSESKFRQDPAAFTPLIQKDDAEGLAALITKPEVEHRLLIRLRKKAMLYAQDFASDGEPMPNGTGKGKIDVDCVVDLYEGYIIPLTKEVEVRGDLEDIVQQTTEGFRSNTCYIGWMGYRRKRLRNSQTRSISDGFFAIRSFNCSSVQSKRSKKFQIFPTLTHVT